MSKRAAWSGVVILAALTGCVAKPDVNLVETVYRGEHGAARQYMLEKLTQNGAIAIPAPSAEPDREFILDRMRLGLVTIADGYAPEVDSAWDHVYQLLRKASLNKNRQAASWWNEDLKIWKGEPFEQALAYHYVGVHYAMQGSWDNVRTAYQNSLFPLQALIPGGGTNEQAIESSKGNEELGSPTEEKTNFALGYLMNGIASQQLALSTGGSEHVEEAKAQFLEVVTLNESLADLVAAFDPKLYNTVLVVEFGRGPEKIGTGMDKVIASFSPHTPSDDAALIVEADGQSASYPWVSDVNGMSQDHRWNNLEDLRIAKSYVGTGMMVAGAATTAYGLGNDSPEAALAGLGIMAAGALVKSSAHADTRYCELIPQRIYVAPLNISSSNATVTLQVANAPQSRLVLTGLNPPAGPSAQMIYVRLVNAAPVAPAWATSGRVEYANDYSPMSGEVRMPYILGGDCVRTPSQEALSSYQQAGNLQGMTLSDLEELYRLEGITWSIQDQNGNPGLHVLEGGRSLLCPRPGSAGYARLFGQKHGGYKPISPRVQELRAEFLLQQSQERIGTETTETNN